MLNNVALIAPKQYMKEIGEENDFHLFLAHMIQGDAKYAELAKEAKGYKILDNSFFELGYSLPVDRLIRLADEINVSCIVLPDGLEGFNQKDKVLGKSSYNVMLVPKTFEQLQSFAGYALSTPRIYVGLSGIHSSNMLREYFNLPVERFACMNRFLVLSQLMSADKHLYKNFITSKKLHLLGLGDYPLLELKAFNLAGIEYTNDSNAYVWPYLHRRVRFDEIEKKQGRFIDFDYFDGCETSWWFYKVHLKPILNDLMGKGVEVCND